VIAGAALGIALTLFAVFGLVAAVDARYITRREHNATMKDIQRQLNLLLNSAGLLSQPDRKD
jgi:hypothetical protein